MKPTHLWVGFFIAFETGKRGQQVRKGLH